MIEDFYKRIFSPKWLPVSELLEYKSFLKTIYSFLIIESKTQLDSERADSSGGKRDVLGKLSKKEKKELTDMDNSVVIGVAVEVEECMGEIKGDEEK